jgi:hypothetical protein
MIDEIYEREKLDAADAAKKVAAQPQPETHKEFRQYAGLAELPEDEQPAPASEPPATDAPPAQRPLMPGESHVQIDAEGMKVTSITMPQSVTFGANRDSMRVLLNKWLTAHDEEFWEVVANAWFEEHQDKYDTLVDARLKARRDAKKHLSIVTDADTVQRIGRSKNGIR